MRDTSAVFQGSSKKIYQFRQKTLRPNWTHAEGMVLGVGAKMFQIAGPVIEYGVSASVVYGFIYWIWAMT